MERDIYSINRVIDNAAGFNSEEKDLLKFLFRKLDNDKAELFRKLQDKVLQQVQELKSNDCDWIIKTELIDKSDAQNLESMFEVVCLDPVSEEKDFSGRELHQDGFTSDLGVGFLRCPYSDIKSIIDRKYMATVECEGETFNIGYKLEHYNGLRDCEIKLERLARQYNVARPSLFSPWSRRAVLVKLDVLDSSFEKLKLTNSSAVVRLCLESNGLKSVLQTGKTLAWNVKVECENEMPRPNDSIDASISALFHNVYHIVEFSVDDNQYVLCDLPSVECKRIKDCVYINASCSSMKDLRYSRYTIFNNANDLRDKNNIVDVFENFCDYNGLSLERIRTQADVEFVMNCFKNPVVSYAGCSTLWNDNYKNVHKYEKGDAYYYTDKKALRGSSKCYISFEVSDRDSWQAEDYISYILSYMNHFYPEFYWVGVYR